MLFKGFVASLVVYFVYVFSTSRSASKPSKGTDWKQAQAEVRDAFLESWHTYEKHAWGKDVFHPISQQGENMGPNPLGWMIVDSLDTLMIMDCPGEVLRARNWIKSVLDYNIDYEVNVFETTIRMMGGLLSAFHLSEDDLYLDRAVDLAGALLEGFKSPSGLPYSSVNLKTGKAIKNHVDNGASSTAEVATLQLEFKYLSHLTGEAVYWEKVEKIMEVLDSNEPTDGLVPIYVNPDTGKYQSRLIRLGSRGDSYYEYLLKQFLQTNEQEHVYYDMYKESFEGITHNMVSYSKPNHLVYIGELENGIKGKLSPKMDHLVCFYGGLVSLGATSGLTLEEARKQPWWNTKKELEFKFGADLTYSCYRMYEDTPTGLAPEIVVFNEDKTKSRDFYIKPLDKHNLQRPETVESLFYLYRLTGDEKYRRYGYKIFQKFVQHSRYVSEEGDVSYTSLDDMTVIPPKRRDNVESFWWAETLKYLFLLFDDENKLPLDKYVFNTEAHPFPRFDMGKLFKTGWRRSKGSEERANIETPNVEIDKNNIPEAAPADKPVDQQVQEEAQKNPEILDH
ncbi:hypothetical protein CANTEDRAFT_110685 [Yamadazyma tenuis ATCC 10573]|uniref:alpha-1,2-Mannosidase n=2 Tax=Candida tenuis TaxID=2315449 RepID=G3BEN0_CANTC|nr:uncharacterized protein CANTEDRAFT_110685 [Yamadazyma tenuis ATCC 10573]EGV59931.1 hypothetical protein CANTEDRAFT_110685 [Yamadazyma tenuis ATCC 10573]